MLCRVLRRQALLGGDGFVPASYGSLDWSAGEWFAFGESEAPYTPHSGAVRAASVFGDADAQTAIGFRIPGFFDGAWFSVCRARP